MNNKFGTSGLYQAREPSWPGTDEDRALRSPDQEFETSANYRQPPDDASFVARLPKEPTRTDERIRADVSERLSWNDELDATEISVRVEDGGVSLEGSVETLHMKGLAEDLAGRVPGVLGVLNHLHVQS